MENLLESFENFNCESEDLNIYESLIKYLVEDKNINDNINAISILLDKRKNILEKKLEYKRKYTETYPAKITYTGAKIRKAVFDSIKNNKISEDELNQILIKYNANPKWKITNKHLFSLTEEEGKKYFILTEVGKKIMIKLPNII